MLEMLVDGVRSLSIHPQGTSCSFRHDKGLSSKSSLSGVALPSSSSDSATPVLQCRSVQVTAVAVGGNNAPPRRAVATPYKLPPLSSQEFIAPKSRREFREVTAALVDETLEMLSIVSLAAGKQAKARDIVHLLLSLWLTKKNVQVVVQEYPEILSGSAADLGTRVNYFLEGGCSAGEIGSAVVRLPRLLSTPMDRIHAMASVLEKIGMEREKIPKVMLKSPMVVEENVGDTINPLFVALRGVAPEPGYVERIVECQPKVLQLSDVDVAERTAVMAEFGLSRDVIASLCLKKPGVLLVEPSVLRERFLNLGTIFRERRLPNIFKVAPTLLVVTPEKVNKKYSLLIDYMGEEVTSKVVNAFPQSVALSWKKVLLPKLEYLIELGLDPSEAVNFPAYLGYSLNDRIRPRCELLLQRGYTIGPHSQVVRAAVETNVKRHGKTHKHLIDMFGSHSVCIQHIVGQKDWEFEEAFGVKLPGVSMRYPSGDFDLENDVDDLEQLEQEAGLTDL